MGSGQGERESETTLLETEQADPECLEGGEMEGIDDVSVVHWDDDADSVADEGHEEQEDSSEPAHPLLFFYDCEG